MASVGARKAKVPPCSTGNLYIHKRQQLYLQWRHKLQKRLHGATLTPVVAIATAAKRRSEFYFRQRLLQLVSQKKLDNTVG
jgi:hypothetical protein